MMNNDDDDDVKVRVRFITQHEKFRVTETPFMVPTSLGRKGLSEVITHLLEGNSKETSMAFDFMIQGNLIRLSLSKFLARFKNSISSEDTITIEYFPAANIDSEKVNSPITVPGWIGSISTVNVRNQEIIVAGCYDGNVQIIVSSSLFESQPDHTSARIDFQAHSEPVRALCTWTIDLDNSTFKSSQGRKAKSDQPQSIISIATASKDHTVKLWNVALHNSTPRLLSTLKCTSSAESLHISPISSSASPSQSPQSLLLCGDWSGCLRGWKLPTDLLAVPGAAPADVDDAKKRRKVDSSSSLAVGSSDPQVSFTIKAHSQALSGLDMDPNASSLLTCSWDHSLKVWDLERQDCVATLVCPKVATSVQKRPLTGDACVAATSHVDGKVRLWDTRVGGASEVNHATSVASFGRSTQWVSQVRWLPGSEFLFGAADYSGAVTLWDCRAASPLACNAAHSGKALCLGWTSIAAKSDTGEVAKGGESVGGNRSTRRKVAAAEEGTVQAEVQWAMVSGGSDSCLRATPLTRTY